MIIIYQSFDTPHSGRIISLSYHSSPHGVPRLLSIAEDQNFIFWDIRRIKIERLLLGSPTELIQCQFVPVPIAHHQSYSKAVPNEKKKKKRAEASTDAVDMSTLIPYEKSLILRSDTNVSLFEMSSGRVTCSLISGHDDVVLCADVSPDGCWIASGSKDQTIRISCSRTEQSLAVLRGHTAPVVALQMNKKM